VIRRLSRRKFVRELAIAIGSFGLPVKVYSQHTASPRRIGVLLVGFSPDNPHVKQFNEGLRDAGYVEGRDVVIDWRSAQGDYARVPALVADLVSSKVDVIVVDSTVAVRAAKQATTTIPIVMAIVADPVGSGVVPNLARPGGNITGLSQMIAELHAKRLQLLKEVIPRLKRVGLLWNPSTQWHAKVVEGLKAVAPSLSIELKIAGASTPIEFDSAFAAFARADVQALYVIEDAFFFAHRATLLRIASKVHLPGTFGAREFADEGGLMAYGTDLGELWRRSAAYVDKILKGAKPADLPIEQPTKFEFVVNLKTAKALGITIPESILLRADEVIR
jgi:putative ABC transport system substrate-binding protein